MGLEGILHNSFSGSSRHFRGFDQGDGDPTLQFNRPVQALRLALEALLQNSFIARDFAVYDIVLTPQLMDMLVNAVQG